MFADDDNKSTKRNGSIGRRSFFKRRSGRNQHQRSGSKDSRELISFTDLSLSGDNVPITDDGPIYYQRVEKIDCKSWHRPLTLAYNYMYNMSQFNSVTISSSFAHLGIAVPRPVVIFGPFANILIQKLVNESPDKYTTCKQESMNASFMEKYVSGGIIDYEQANDHFKVTLASDLHEVAASVSYLFIQQQLLDLAFKMIIVRMTIMA